MMWEHVLRTAAHALPALVTCLAAFLCPAARADIVVAVNTTSLTFDGNTGTIELLKANPGPDGKISFPEALDTINNQGGGCTIRFDLPHGSEINVGLVPGFLDSSFTTIDGDTNGDGLPDVLLYAAPRTPPLVIQASHVTVRNLAFAGIGLFSVDANHCEIVDCYIGTSVDGEVAGPGQGNGVEILAGAHDNVVDRCIVAGNVVPDPNFIAVGIFIYDGAHHNEVTSCWVGLNVNGNPVPNENGIQVGTNDGAATSFNTIGGARPADGSDGPGNVISGNTGNAVQVLGPGSTGNIVQGNFIGTDETGKTAVGNGGPSNFTPLFVGRGATGNRIGGTRLTTHGGEGNLISGNGGTALVIRYPGSAGNIVQGNIIGTDITGKQDLGNGGYGIFLSTGAADNVIGSSVEEQVDTARGNLIADNTLGGIIMRDAGTVRNTIRGNEIFDNGGRGIDLSANDRALGDEVTPNDTDDADTGPNDLLNFPVGVTSWYDKGEHVYVVSGLWQGPDPESKTIDIYANKTVDEVGFGEGAAFLGSCRPNAGGAFRLKVGTMPDFHHFLSATATDAFGSTSEFGPCYGDPDGDGDPDSDADGLPDDWETGGIDFNGDGSPDVFLNEAPFNANPMHKDVFVEIDYMEAADHTHRPDLRPDKGPMPANPLQAVVNAFANAPVTNPDGVTGVKLHAMIDEAIPDIPAIHIETRPPGDADDFHDLKYGKDDIPTDGHLGTRDERGFPNAPNILGARQLAFRYCIFGHTAAEGETIGGIGEIAGDDFEIVMANWVEPARNVAGAWSSTGTITPTEEEFEVEWLDAVAGTFMHELGHTLGLFHGGGAGLPDGVGSNRLVHRKPNYLSVMNYARQYSGAGDALHLPGIPDGKLVRLFRKLDYSRSALPTLLEFDLSEAAGVGGPADERILYGVKGERKVGLAGGPVDWNGNGTADDTKLDLDINYIHGASSSDPSPGEILYGHDDWGNLVFSSRASTQFGAAVAEAGSALGEMTARDYLSECLGGDRTPADALKIAGGVLRSEPPDLVLLDRVASGASANRLDLLDAVRAARHAAGLDP